MLEYFDFNLFSLVCLLCLRPFAILAFERTIFVFGGFLSMICLLFDFDVIIHQHDTTEPRARSGTSVLTCTDVGVLRWSALDQQPFCHRQKF